MFHHHHDSKKKLKKLLQQKKNRFQQELFNLLRLRRQEDERVKENEAKMAPKPAERSDDGPASDKVATIRNRLTDKKRHSRERWNRFAGTSGGGGRGL